MRGTAIATVRLSTISPREREFVLLDPAVLCEHLANTQGHYRIVGERPWVRREPARCNELRKLEELLAKGVTDRKPIERKPHPLRARITVVFQFRPLPGLIRRDYTSAANVTRREP